MWNQTYPLVAFCLKGSPLTLSDFFVTVWPAALASWIAAIGLLFSQPIISNAIDNSWLNLCVEIFYFGIIYVVIWFILPGNREYTTMIISGIKRGIRRLARKDNS